MIIIFILYLREVCKKIIYFCLSKNEKRKYNYTFFENYFSTNIFFKSYYIMGDNNHIANHIKYYIKKK